MNLPRLKATAKVDALDTLHFAILAITAIGAGTGFDALTGHDRGAITVLALLTVIFGVASLTHSFLAEAFADRRKRLTDAKHAAAVKTETVR